MQMLGHIGSYCESGGRSDGLDIPGNLSHGLQTVSTRDHIMKHTSMTSEMMVVFLTFINTNCIGRMKITGLIFSAKKLIRYTCVIRL